MYFGITEPGLSSNDGRSIRSIRNHAGLCGITGSTKPRAIMKFASHPGGKVVLPRKLLLVPGGCPMRWLDVTSEHHIRACMCDSRSKGRYLLGGRCWDASAEERENG